MNKRVAGHRHSSRFGHQHAPTRVLCEVRHSGAHMVIDHIGIVVRSLEEGMRQWTELFGYTASSPIVANSRQKVNVIFLSKEDSLTVKLVEPSDPNSSIATFARRGGGLHHICFRCESLNALISVLQGKGARLIVPPEPGEAFRNNPIAFFIADNNLNFELLDTEEKEGLQ